MMASHSGHLPAGHVVVCETVPDCYRNRLVFFIMLSGCLENCLPWRFALRFALVVAAYSAELSDLIAASGRYRSPVSLLFLPLLVRHFCLPQSLSDFLWCAHQSR